MILLNNIQKLESGLKRKKKEEKERKQPFSLTILDLDETHNRTYNANLKQY